MAIPITIQHLLERFLLWRYCAISSRACTRSVVPVSMSSNRKFVVIYPSASPIVELRDTGTYIQGQMQDLTCSKILALNAGFSQTSHPWSLPVYEVCYSRDVRSYRKMEVRDLKCEHNKDSSDGDERETGSNHFINDGR